MNNDNDNDIDINDKKIKKEKKIRKFNTSKRKKLVDKIGNIIDNNVYYKIFNIIKNMKTVKYTENNNGIFFNINKLSDDIIEKIVNIVNTSLENLDTSEIKLDYTPYSVDKYLKTSNFGPRLSNKEKNILNKKSKE